MSTQILTELPDIQQTGMDFDSVMAELQTIIRNNPNWSDNWTGFYSSEAGQMFLQLMSWICDNITTRQDVLLNESFLSTANKKKNKIRLLKQIGYQPKLSHSSQVALTIELNAVQDEDVIITPEFSATDSLVLRANRISKTTSEDINGNKITWEILPLSNNIPDYLGGVKLKAGGTLYTTDSNDNVIYAIQGETQYKEFTSATSDGPFIDLYDENISSDSITVYVKNGVKKCQQVSSFVSTEAMSTDYGYPYIISLNDDGSLRIRFPNKNVLNEERLLPAGTTVSIFYRTNTGSVGNVQAGTINTTNYFTTESGKKISGIIHNEAAAYNGTDAEEIDSAVLNAPLTLRTLDRAVTVEDFDILLKANPNILKVKTYTASNNPNDFYTTYGRYINPQEAFIFALINRDYEKIPSEKYNDYPWISLYRIPRLNEKYSFESGDNNVEVTQSDTYYNFTIFENGETPKNFNNATILDIGKTFNDAVLNDLNNPAFQLKISTSEEALTYFKNIPYTLLTSNKTIGKMYTTDLNDHVLITVDDNARFVSNSSYEKEIDGNSKISCIDIINARYIIFSLDGRTEIKIDLWENYEGGMPSEHYYILWDHEPITIAEASESTQDACYRRHGIIQLINSQIVAISTGQTSQSEAANVYTENNAYQWFGIKVSDPDNTFLSFDDNNYLRKDFIFSINGITFKFPFSNGTNTMTYREFVDELNEHFQYSSSVRLYEEGYWVTNTYDLRGLKADIVQTTNYLDGDYSYSYDVFIKTESTDWLQDGNINISYDVVSAVLSSGDTNTYKGINYDEQIGYFSFIHALHNLDNTAIDYTTLLGAKFEATNYENLATMLDDPANEENQYFSISSPIQGKNSSIQFMTDEVYEDGYGNFMRDFLELYFNSQNSSQRAYGQKKVYLLKSGAEAGYKQDITDPDFTTLDSTLQIGNLIFENSCIYNTYDFTSLYAFYKLEDNTSLVIGSVYDNFYCTGEPETDEKLKDKLVHLTGTVLNADGTVNNTASKYELKLTKEPFDTNSFYAIKEDIDAIPCDRVKICSANIAEEIPEASISITFDTAGLFISPPDGTIIDISLTGLKNGPEVVKAIREGIASAGNDIYKDYIDSVNSVVYTSYDCLNQVVIKNLSRENGNITFYYPGRFSDENIKNMHRILFGTSNTNSELYKLYPIDMFDSRNIVGLDDQGNFIEPTYDTDGNITCEYFYCPVESYPLHFTYRTMVKENGVEVSKPGDYYVTYNQDSETYLLAKTENSLFPSADFYMHFINDRSSLVDLECDEKTINEYMNDKKISGMDLYLAQPYFRGYDIKATVYYNANYSEATVKAAVETKVKKLCGIENAEIGGYMSQAKIIKEIMSCEGVENTIISYFGYDATDQNSESQVQINAKFFEIIHINDNDEQNKHGIVFSYEVQG